MKTGGGGGAVSKKHWALDRKRWAVTRRRVFERDAYTCQNCGQRGGRLECHHVLAMWIHKEQDAYDLEGLQTVCRHCHIRITRREVQKYRESKKPAAVLAWEAAIQQLRPPM